MKHWILATALVVLFAGPALAETRDVGAFREVSVTDRIEVEVTSGAEFAVEVSGGDADRVRTRVENGVLKISDGRRPWFGSPRLDATIRVSAPSLTGVAGARGASVSATLNQPQCGDFSVASAMGASVVVDGLRCRTVSASAAMGATMNLEGACGTLEASAAMGAQVRADRLQCDIADASAAMGADVRVFASQSYDASAAMGGSSNVAGGASLRDTSAAMGGTISHNR